MTAGEGFDMTGAGTNLNLTPTWLPKVFPKKIQPRANGKSDANLQKAQE